MDSWTSENDVDFDMFVLSEFRSGDKYKPKRTHSKSEKVSQEKIETKEIKSENPKNPPIKSIYDFDFDATNVEEKRDSGRGRGYVMKKFYSVNKANSVMPSKVLDQTERDIREVCPMPYTNENIQASLKSDMIKNGDLKTMDELKFATSDRNKCNGTTRSKETVSSNSSDLPSDFVEYDLNKDFPQLKS